MLKLRSPCGREGQVRFQKTLELGERLVIEGDVSQVCRLEPGLAQTVLDSPSGEAGIMLLARETLLLRRRDNIAVDDQGGRAVVIIRGNS